MSVQSIFHTGFVVSDLDASLRFYCDGLGLVLRHRQVQHNPYTAVLLGYPDAAIEIAQLKFAGSEPPPSGHVLELISYTHPPSADADLERSTLGSGHLAFVVDDIFKIAEVPGAARGAFHKLSGTHSRGDQCRRLGGLPARPRRRDPRACPAEAKH